MPSRRSRAGAAGRTWSGPWSSLWSAGQAIVTISQRRPSCTAWKPWTCRFRLPKSAAGWRPVTIAWKCPGHRYDIPAAAIVHRLETVDLPVSSSEIRRRLAAGDDRVEVSAAVLDYIRTRGLYRG